MTTTVRYTIYIIMAVLLGMTAHIWNPLTRALAEAAEVPTYQAALLVVNPTARPVEDGYDCGQGWVMDEYEPTHNGGAHVICVKMKKGETRQGFIARRNAGKQYRLVF